MAIRSWVAMGQICGFNQPQIFRSSMLTQFDMIQCSQQSVKTTILLSYRSQCISQLPIQKRSKRHKIITSYHQFTKRYEKYLYVIVCTCSPKIPSSWFPYGSHQERQLSSLFRRLFGASAAWTRQGHVGHVTHFPNGSV